MSFLKSPKGIAAALVFGVLAGCTQVEITSPPVKASYIKGFNQSRVAGSSESTVRTYMMQDGKRVEVGGANCVAQSNEVRVAFTSPAKLVLPAFVQRKEYAERGRPSHLRIECKLNGKTGIISTPAADKEVSTATNAGIGGAILTAVVSGALAASTPWKYPTLLTLALE